MSTYEDEMAKPNTVIYGFYRVTSRNEEAGTAQIVSGGRTYHTTTDKSHWFWVASDGITRFQQ